MATCFVIQPFDAGKFDKRYDQIFVPAIQAANLEPYRVDKDYRVDVPIEAIELGIKAASVCLAEITIDNPNVWYELGFAFASGVPVVMVCAEVREGKKYPFDIQHRTVTSYASDAPEDFKQLGDKVTKRLIAASKHGQTIRQLAQLEPVAAIAGLEQVEMTILATLAGNVGAPDGVADLFTVQQDSERAGLTKIGVAIGLRRLLAKSFIRQTQILAFDQEPYPGLEVSDLGWDWIEANEDKFLLRRNDNGPIEDGIPF